MNEAKTELTVFKGSLQQTTELVSARANPDWVSYMSIASPHPYRCLPRPLNSLSIMAVRLSAATSVSSVTRLVVKRSPRISRTRQFSCTAIRAKEVANQDELPNLRHAQRPREC